MKESKETHARLLAHCAAYPALLPRDLFKYIYQSAFGCEHLLASQTDAAAYIRREYEAIGAVPPKSPEWLDGAYHRVFLSSLDAGLSPETLAALFCRSAKSEENGRAALLEKIEVARMLVAEGKLPFAAADFERELAEWREAGYPPVRHTEAFREAYTPAYRVISNDFVPFLPLFAAIDSALSKGRVLLAIEGGSASGKTTLSRLLAEIYGSAVFHMDDFFLRPEQRTPARFAEVGGNVDRERFLAEVLLPLSEGRRVVYRPFDCSRQELADPVAVSPTRLTVVEGAYSMHPQLAPYYDLSALLDIAPAYQKKRIEKRNAPTLAARFFAEWIPMERIYFEATDVKKRVDLVIDIEE